MLVSDGMRSRQLADDQLGEYERVAETEDLEFCLQSEPQGQLGAFTSISCSTEVDKYCYVER